MRSAFTARHCTTRPGALDMRPFPGEHIPIVRGARAPEAGLALSVM